MKTRFMVILLACVASKIGAQTSSPALVGPGDVCGLLPGLDVAETVGTPLKEGVARLRTGTLASCSFAGERGAQVSILVRLAPTADWESEQVGRMSRAGRFGTYREVPGIGDRAFLYDMQRNGAVLCVFGAGYYLQVSLWRREEAPRTPDVLKKLAGLALARLRLKMPAQTAPSMEPLRLTTAGRPAGT